MTPSFEDGPRRTQSQPRDSSPPGGDASNATAIWRIIDANLNRAAEGLRVVEEFARFDLDDRALTETCKSLRHQLAEEVARLPAEARCRARETTADVGAGVELDDEYKRASPSHIAKANLRRVAEALRCVEEYAKLASPRLARQCESMRYASYTLERLLGIHLASHSRLKHARLYVLIDGRESADAFTSLAESLIEAGVDVLQLRDKQLSDHDLLARARLLRKMTAGGETLMIVNDRPDIAALARADGVHVGQTELAIKDVRTVVGPEMLIGVSTHSLEQVNQAVADGADYLGCGPVFPSGTKDFDSYPGVDFLQQARAATRLPAFAIGGISLENAPQVLETGFARIAVSGAVLNTTDPAAAARQLKTLLSAHLASIDQAAATTGG